MLDDELYSTDYITPPFGDTVSGTADYISGSQDNPVNPENNEIITNQEIIQQKQRKGIFDFKFGGRKFSIMITNYFEKIVTYLQSIPFTLIYNG